MSCDWLHFYFPGWTVVVVEMRGWSNTLPATIITEIERISKYKQHFTTSHNHDVVKLKISSAFKQKKETFLTFVRLFTVFDVQPVFTFCDADISIIFNTTTLLPKSLWIISTFSLIKKTHF